MPEQQPDVGRHHHPGPEHRATGAGPDGSRYRSLRELSGGSRSTTPGPAPEASPWGRPGQPGPGGGHPDSLPPGWTAPEQQPAPAGGAPAPAAHRGGLRYVVVGALVVLLVVGLTLGGYVAYRQFAPYYGLGYAAGGSATVKDVTFTVTGAKCGLSDAPGRSATPVRGQFCTVTVHTVNNADKTRYLSLSMFALELNTGSRANPARTAMVMLSTKLAPGQSRDLELVYDVWNGIRMDTLKVQIGYETATIPLV